MVQGKVDGAHVTVKDQGLGNGQCSECEEDGQRKTLWGRDG